MCCNNGLLSAVLLVSWIAVLCGSSPNALAAEQLPTIIPAQVPAIQLDDKSWNEPTKLDERDVRVIKSGADAVIKVKPWWPGSLRPAEGQYWTIVVQYKDTASKPIIISAFGNIGRNNSRTELHRFGGLNDGQWKSAQIPLGWDMIMSRPDTAMAELSLYSVAGDVPVASIGIKELNKSGLAEAAEQYNRETREWIARVQQVKMSESRNEFEAPQKPVDAVVSGKEEIVPYVRPYLQQVYPYSAPQPGEVGKPLEATMSQNEYEPAAFGVYAAARDLTNVRVKIDDLRHESGARATLLASLRTAEYALVPNNDRSATRAGAQSQPATRPAMAYGITPQRLWPMYARQIRKGESCWFWVTFQSDPQTTTPGVYTGNVTILSDQGKTVLPVKVTVLPIRLLDMQEAGLEMGGCVTGLLSRHEMEMMPKYNHNMINLWLSGVAPRIIPKGQEDFDLDFTLLDDFMTQMKAAGIKSNVWFLGGDPYGFPMTAHLERQVATQVLGLSNQQYSQLIDKDRMNIPPQIAPLCKKWVAKVMQHAKEYGWPEQILTPFDEPAKWAQQPGRKNDAYAKDPNVMGTGPWIKPHFEQGCALIREAAPGTRIYGSIHHAANGLPFLKDVDVFCTNAIHQDGKLGDKVRAGGKAFWQYSGIGSNDADRGRFAFGFYFNAFDSRGSLCWAYNWGSRFDTSEGENWEYAWYTPLDTIPAPYYEALREAWDDRRYVETLKKIAHDNKADISAFLAEIADAARNQRDEGGRDTVNDFWAQAKRVGAMDELRGKVIQKILELSRKNPAQQ